MKNNVEPSSPKQVSEEVTLSRDLGLFTITMIGVGGMIGAGIFVLTGIAAGVAGPAFILAFLLNGIVTMFTAMAYAELGSAFPEAGGAYLWVKRALGGTQGFLSGWMSWFANAVAGSLYGLAFGRFATEIILMADLPMFGLSIGQLTLIFMTAIISLFTFINYLGASETGFIGNILTIAKVAILGLFVFFGVLAVQRTGQGLEPITSDFMPNGFFSVIVAMGLTFIAFEGYEIIVQSSEEVIEPQRNIPRAIFISIGVVVIIYLAVGATAIAAVEPPAGVTAYDYLAQRKEIAVMEVAGQTFPAGSGTIILLLSGLASTMSALNAITFSSSRISFAMGRDLNLPRIFSLIHPKRHTPYWAVILSGLLMIAMAWALPIEDVAAAADIMFLLLFLQVNVAVMVLRRREPKLPRGFLIPLFPIIPLLAIVINGLLAAQLFAFSPTAWYFALAWLAVGLLAYYSLFARLEALEKPPEILHEEVLVSRHYSVLVPIADLNQARDLGHLGIMLARVNQGEVLALHVVEVPPQLGLGEGRLFLKEGREYLEQVIRQAKQEQVPVHTVIRLGRRAADGLRKTALENGSNLILLGWTGYTGSSGNLFGSVIDPIVDDPPADVAVVRYRNREPWHRILVPVSGGPNSRRAVRLALQLAQASQSECEVTLLHVLPDDASQGDEVRANQVFDYCLEGVSYPSIGTALKRSSNPAEGIVRQAEQHDLVIIGATDEPLFKNFLVGTLPEWVSRHSPVSVIMVKRRSSSLHTFLRQTVLGPTQPKSLEE